MLGDRGRARAPGARRRARGWPRRARRTSVNVRPWPARHSRASSACDRVQRGAGTRRPDRASSRSRSTATRGRAGGRRRSSRRRSGWCRQTCDGAWPGVSTTRPRAEVGVDDDAGHAASRSGSTSARDPAAAVARRLPTTRAAARPARRSGARPRSGARARSSGSLEAARMCAWRGASTARSRWRRRRSPPGRSGRSARACRRAAARRSGCRPTCAIARSSCASEPGSCRPQSNSTTPSPAATA